METSYPFSEPAAEDQVTRLFKCGLFFWSCNQRKEGRVGDQFVYFAIRSTQIMFPDVKSTGITENAFLLQSTPPTPRPRKHWCCSPFLSTHLGCVKPWVCLLSLERRDPSLQLTLCLSSKSYCLTVAPSSNDMEVKVLLPSHSHSHKTLVAK